MKTGLRYFWALFATSALLLAACGDGNGGQNNPPPADTTPPVISLTGANPQVIALGDPYTELGASASDNVDGDVSASIVIDASGVDTSTAGDYEVTYNVTDAAGNAAATMTRTVTVLAALPPLVGIEATPSVVLSGSATTLTWGSIYADSCSASGDWSDPIGTLGTLITDPLISASKFTVNCVGHGGSASATATVNLTTFPVASVSVDVWPTTIEVGQSAQVVATVYDSGGMPLEGRLVIRTSDDPSIASVSPDGRAIGRSPGVAILTTESEGQTTQFDLTVTTPGADDRQLRINAMYSQLPSLIASAIEDNESLLEGNSRLRGVIEALLEVLRSPTLEEEIRSGNYVEATVVASLDDRRLPIVSMFPQASSRENAIRANGYVQLALPLLEDFLQVPFPREGIDLWYGFHIGNRGGGGTIWTEDQTTYETRRGPVVIGYLPYESIIHHEIAHTYFGNEYLTQFLELYAYNRIYTNSLEVESWVFTREYEPFLDSNSHTHGLLDIYQLIGRDAMAKAFQSLYPLRPPYGQPLSEAGKQAIVNEAPLAQQDQVRAILDRGI